MRGVRRRVSVGAPLAACSILLAACSLPRDSDGTLDRIRGGSVRVGVAENPPWVHSVGDSVRIDSVSGIEAAIAVELARRVGAKPEWHRGSESELLHALHERELDLVIGGLTSTSPWTKEVAFTKPYYSAEDGKHVLAVAPGENAWLVEVERYLRERGPAVVSEMGGPAEKK